MASVRRATKEFKEVAKNCSDFAEVEHDGDNALAWNVCLNGPAGTAYEGGKFQLKFNFPADYPFKPPSVSFAIPTQIFHPNVDEQGAICLDLLKTKYSPACSMTQVLNAIHTIMEAPSTEAPLNQEAGALFDNDREKFNAAVIDAWNA
eukprot:TRINITY_DN1198_c0_g1_i5.p1 TRINITY_DN1198_c0_g1~~TRINITY_DN1198_c0_g1_i5.p1  ORF type:complete len:148 (+),score=29.20 TRINITY_DN1198_c0_g1_i5:184-627(+)